MKRRGRCEETLEIGLVEPPPTGAARAHFGGNLALAVEAVFLGFSASVQAWIHEEAWAAFLADLSTLERTRQGTASLEAMSPDELSLRFRATDRAGHMAIDGFLGFRGTHTAKMTFSEIRFDPSELPRIMRELEAFAP